MKQKLLLITAVIIMCCIAVGSAWIYNTRNNYHLLYSGDGVCDSMQTLFDDKNGNRHILWSFINKEKGKDTLIVGFIVDVEKSKQWPDTAHKLIGYKYFPSPTETQSFKLDVECKIIKSIVPGNVYYVSGNDVKSIGVFGEITNDALTLYYKNYTYQSLTSR